MPFNKQHYIFTRFYRLINFTFSTCILLNLLLTKMLCIYLRLKIKHLIISFDGNLSHTYPVFYDASCTKYLTTYEISFYTLLFILLN